MPRLLFLLTTLAGVVACAPRSAVPSAGGRPAPSEAITREELRRDLFALAGDSMRGREAGTLDEMRASLWVAERAREAGLEPAGDDGTFFQFFELQRVRVAEGSRIAVGAAPLRLWEDVWVTAPTDARVDAPLVWLDRLADTVRTDLRGKAVALRIAPPDPLPPREVSLWEFRYTLGAIRQQAQALRRQGAAAVVLVADSVADTQFGFVGHRYEDGQFGIEAARPDTAAPVLWTRARLLPRLRRPGQRLVADLRTDRFTYPSVNVVARAPGRDPALRGEHVLFSGHSDHDGVGEPVDGDSIWNGADDNATVSVALLAIGRRFVREPGRRSVLFVWHGAEEKGLLGSRWFVEHPTVPKQSIVAVLNGDMIGRNHPDSAALLGAVPPHRNSVALVEMALEANRRTANFALDTSWDDPAHPEGWYFRSDHLPYARAGIPAVFFTTLLHPDYHTPHDNPERIDIAKLARMTRWMYATGRAVADAAERPGVDAGFRLER
jgi:hypothetical protein